MCRSQLKLKCGQTRCTLLTFLPATSLQIVVKMLAVLQNHWRIQYNSVSQCCGISLNCTNSESTHTSFTIDFPPGSGCGPHSCPVIPVTLELPHQEPNDLCKHRLPSNSLYDTANYKKWNISKDISKLVSDEKNEENMSILGREFVPVGNANKFNLNSHSFPFAGTAMFPSSSKGGNW